MRQKALLTGKIHEPRTGNTEWKFTVFTPQIAARVLAAIAEQRDITIISARFQLINERANVYYLQVTVHSNWDLCNILQKQELLET